MSRAQNFSGAADLARGATEYANRLGLARPSDFSNIVIAPHHQEFLAQQYEAAPVRDEAAVPAFRQFHEETGRQFDYLTRPRSKGGLGIQVEVTTHDPYKDAGEMVRDVRENSRLQVMSTASTGGHFLGDEHNDRFRAVHDAFGHASTGRAFDRHGEEAAYQSHASMYTPLARRAMATETRGQNAVFIRRGDFPDQKMALLPHGTDPLSPLHPAEAQKLRLQASQFHRAMGL